MKNLLYKEFRLAIHPSVYIFFALAALLLVPSYPYYVSFFYLMLGIFLTCKTNGAAGACQHPHRHPVCSNFCKDQSRGRQ